MKLMRENYTNTNVDQNANTNISDILDEIMQKYNGYKYRIKVQKYKNVHFIAIRKLSANVFKNNGFWKTEKLYVIDGFNYDSIEHFQQFCFDCFNENPTGDNVLDTLHSVIGISGESGELLELFKKSIFHCAPIQDVKIKSESGDILFYYLVFLKFCKLDIKDVIHYNMAKLKDRYPEGRTKNYKTRKIENFEQLEKSIQWKSKN